MGKSLAAANVRKAFRLLSNSAPPFPEEVKVIADGAGRSLRNILGKESLTASPVFYRIDQDFRCAQQGFFGFYLLSQGIRSCLSSVNFQIAGGMTLESELYAPATALFYTSAYHALSGYLAINGRVLLDSQVFNWVSSEEKPPVIAACLTRDNYWKFESRPRNHRARWLELKNIFASRQFEIPDYFRRLFGYLYGGRRKPGSTILQRLTEPEKYRAQIEDYTDEFLKRIAAIRHAALYSSAGEDPYVVEAIANREPIGSANLGRQAEEVGIFSQSLLSETARYIRKMIEEIEIDDSVKMYLYLSAGQPWIDKARCDLWETNDIQEDIDFIQCWLTRPGEEDEQEKPG